MNGYIDKGEYKKIFRPPASEKKTHEEEKDKKEKKKKSVWKKIPPECER